MTFSSIAILSPGLLGGSVALAIRRRMPGVEVRIWTRRLESLEKIRSLALANTFSTDAPAIAAGADLILFCMPIGAMAAVAGQIAPVVSPGALITDVGSVKQPVVERLGKIFDGRAQFIGSHPMAGSEQTGIDAARADLFENAVTILTPGEFAKKESVETLSAFWQALGSRVAVSTPRAHDEAVALVSHLPHLAAAILIQVALRENPAALDWRGSGFMDTTRVASGPAAMWAEILMENSAAVKKAVHAMIENLAWVTKLLDAGDSAAVEDYLAEAKQARDRLKQKPTS